MLIDSHCHLHDKEFYSAKKAEECLKRAHEKGVEKIICIGTSHEDSLKAAEFAKEHENVYWTYGIHPEYATSKEPEPIFSDAGLEFLSTSYTGAPAEPSLRDEPVGHVRNIRVKNSNHFMHPKKISSASHPVAIGEVGLDYHYDDYDRKAQIKLFEQMLQLAKDLDLPLSFHIRDAFPDFFDIIENFPKARGVVHSFTGSKRVLKRILEQTDFYIGVNGLATYSTLPMPPLERILLETDAPFLAPTPVRGETNEPSHIFEIAEWLAGALDLDFETIEKATAKNTEKLFKI
ncbi:TatD family hydrolase [Candidatus Saccharibacteria bacterium]|nr:TatD family hydrolase [Candidatus Saccharibacteria bacterium]